MIDPILSNWLKRLTFTFGDHTREHVPTRAGWEMGKPETGTEMTAWVSERSMMHRFHSTLIIDELLSETKYVNTSIRQCSR